MDMESSDGTPGIDITISEKIKLLLNKNGYTQNDLAEHLGVKKQSVSRNMKEDGWRIDTLAEIADFFGAKLDIYLVVDGKRYDTSGLDLSGQLHNLMKDQKVNQTDLGRKVGMKQVTLSSQILKQNYKINRIKPICEALGAELHIDFITNSEKI